MRILIKSWMTWTKNQILAILEVLAYAKACGEIHLRDSALGQHRYGEHQGSGEPLATLSVIKPAQKWKPKTSPITMLSLR